MNRRLASLVLAVLALAGVAAPASAGDPPTTVYAYRNGANHEGVDPAVDNGFSAMSAGWVYSQMGFLGPKGEPPFVDDRGNVHRGGPDGPIVGHAITDDEGRTIGFRNLDGTRECYNMDVTPETLDTAWKAVAESGNLVVCAHGARVGTPQEPVTGIVLHGGDTFSGVRAQGSRSDGTGMAGADPYELTPRPNAMINVTLWACYSTFDGDGEGPAPSVAETFESVPGVQAPVAGGEGVAQFFLSPAFSNEATPAERARMIAAGQSAAAGNRHVRTVQTPDGPREVGDIGAWIASLPFPFQMAALRLVVALARAGPVGAVCIAYPNPAYAAPGAVDCESELGGYYAPPVVVSEEGTTITFAPPCSPQTTVLEIPAGAVADFPAVLLGARSFSPAPPVPCGQRAASFIASVADMRNQPLDFAVPATLRLTFCQEAVVLGFFRMDGDVLLPHPFTSTPEGVEAQITSGGTFLVLRAFDLPERADLNGGAMVDSSDLGLLLSAWWSSDSGADLDCSGLVDEADLGLMLGAWGEAVGPCAVGP